MFFVLMNQMAFSFSALDKSFHVVPENRKIATVNNVNKKQLVVAILTTVMTNIWWL